MDTEFDHKKWDDIRIKLLMRYPQLTDADVIWRHETKDELFRTIASGLGITKNEFEHIVDQF